MEFDISSFSSCLLGVGVLLFFLSLVAGDHGARYRVISIETAVLFLAAHLYLKDVAGTIVGIVILSVWVVTDTIVTALTNKNSQKVISDIE